MKLSEELIKAKAALQKREDLPGYDVNMATYHEYDAERDICYICLAGAYMEECLGILRTKDQSCCTLPEEQSKICYKISSIALESPVDLHSVDRKEFYNKLDHAIERIRQDEN